MGTENCHAELLQVTCEATAHRRGSYRFGDASRQLARNVHSRVKETVVAEAVKEQEQFGKFQKVKELAEEVRRRWDDVAVRRWVLLCQVLSVLAVQLTTWAAMLLVAGPIHGPRAWRLASWQATQSSATLLAVQLLLAALVLLAARWVLLYSELIHAFVLEVLFVDLKAIGVDLQRAAGSVQGVSWRAAVAASAMWVGVAGVWMQQLGRL